MLYGDFLCGWRLGATSISSLADMIIDIVSNLHAEHWNVTPNNSNVIVVEEVYSWCGYSERSFFTDSFASMVKGIERMRYMHTFTRSFSPTSPSRDVWQTSLHDQVVTGHLDTCAISLLCVTCTSAMAMSDFYSVAFGLQKVCPLFEMPCCEMLL